jgi:hypothetical protein
MITERAMNTFWLQSTKRQWRPLPTTWQEDFLLALMEFGTIYGAAKATGVHRGSVYYRRERDPDFAERLARVLAKSARKQPA